MLAERILGGVIGNILVQLGIVSYNQLSQALEVQRKLDAEQIKTVLTPEQQVVIDRICTEKEGSNCAIDVVVKAAGHELQRQGLPALPESLPKGPNLGEVLRMMGVVADERAIELAGAVQAVDRVALLTKALGPQGIKKRELEHAKLVLADAPTVSLDKIDAQPWIDSAPALTREAQATQSLVQLFVDILERAEQRGETLYQQPVVKEAVAAAGALAYLQKKSIADAFGLAGYPDIAKGLHEEIRETRMSDIGEDKPGLLGRLARGITHGLETLGYRKDGSERGFLGGLARGLANRVAHLGYTVSQESAVSRLISGIQAGVDALTAGPMRSNSIDPLMIYGWIEKRAEQAGLNRERVHDILTSYRPDDVPLISQAALGAAQQQALPPR